MKQFLIASALLLPAWSAAFAEDHEDIRVRVGLGAQMRPDFLGADSRELAPAWRINIARGDKEFPAGSPGDSWAIPLLSSGGFSFGPAANVASGRKDSDVGVPLGKVPTTFEAGGFAQYQAGEHIRLRGELLKGIGGHEGLVGAAGVDGIWRDADRWVFTIGPRVRFSDGRYQRAYFGVTPSASLASGLPEYRPGGGVHALGLASGAFYGFNPQWGMFGFARYDRLVGDAGNSPIDRDLGSRNQLAAGLGLTYTFTIHR
jgi:outer membrane protein